MTVRLSLPAGREWTKITDGTHSAYLTGVAGDVELYIGSDTPGADSASHPVGRETTIRSPVVAWVRAAAHAAGRAEITYSTW